MERRLPAVVVTCWKDVKAKPRASWLRDAISNPAHDDGWKPAVVVTGWKDVKAKPRASWLRDAISNPAYDDGWKPSLHGLG